MSREKKTHKYIFDDGIHEIPSSFNAVCTKTGKIVPIYHKVLVDVIERRYDNNFKTFIDNYVSPDYKKEVQEDEEKDKFRINIYGIYLILCYKEAMSKNDQYNMFLCEERFIKNFKKDIKENLEFTLE